MSQNETMKVEPWGEGQGDHVVINKSDFNPEIHKEFKGSKKAENKEPKGLQDMTAAELKAYATEKGYDLGSARNKADLIKAIETAENGVNFASDEAGELAVNNNLTAEQLAEIEGSGEDGALTVGDVEDYLANLGQNGDN